jgi:ATP-dependent protease ClpP protease subunit
MRKLVIITVALVLSLTFVNMAGAAEIKELSKGKMYITGMIYHGDFIKFYKLTMDKKIRNYHIILDTPGGDAYTTVALLGRIKEMKREGITFTMEAYGMSMSAGSYLFMMGDKRIIHDGAQLMWHTIGAQSGGMKPFRASTEQWKSVMLLDTFIRKEFKKATGLSDKWVAFWLDSKKANFMSAATAYNIGIATHYVD